MAVGGYRIRIRLESGSYGPWTDVGDIETYQFTGLQPDTRYCVQIQAYCDTGNPSELSNEYCFRTDAGCNIIDCGDSNDSFADTVDGGNSSNSFPDTIDFNCV